MAHKNKRIKVINIQEFLPSMAATREERSRDVFPEAWVEFVIVNAGGWAQQNGGGKLKQYTNEVFDLQSIRVFRGLSYIATAK